MDKQRIAYLHQRHLDGHLSPAEAAEWAKAVHADEHRETIHALMKHTWAAITPGNEQPMPHALRTFKRVVKPSQTRRLWPWLSAAGLLLVASAVFWLSRFPSPSGNQAPVAKNITPGGQPPTLSRSDGTTVTLNAAQAGIVVGDGITYHDGSEVEAAGKTDAYTLRTPPGSTFQVTLPDGTDVWLNAASTLTYPSQFARSERRVNLSGEAYFSVAKDEGRPFIVESRDQQVTVVGTAFNINAYADEASTATTLVSGRISVTANGSLPIGGTNTYRLSPGQQSVFQQGAFRIQAVDTGQYTAWMKGRFNFDGKTLPEVMRELSRWYGIKVIYPGDLPDLVFYGGAQRNSNLDMVLTLLETNGIRYHLTPDTTLVLAEAHRLE